MTENDEFTVITTLRARKAWLLPALSHPTASGGVQPWRPIAV